MTDYYGLIAKIAELAQQNASPETILRRVETWAKGTPVAAATAQPVAPQQPAGAVKGYIAGDFPKWLSGLFDMLLPQAVKPTAQETQAILEAAQGDAELVAALAELLKWRIDNHRLNSANRVAGLMLRMLKEDNHEDLKRKGLQIFEVRIKAEQQPQPKAQAEPAAKPQVKEMEFVPGVVSGMPVPNPKLQPVKPAQSEDPIEALMSQVSDSTPENVAKLQTKLTEFLARQKAKPKPAPQAEDPGIDYDEDPPIE
jgi:hypothetical protein